MILFDVKSLLTNVPLDETIETILQKVYVEKKIKTSMPKPILKEVLFFTQNIFILDLMVKYIPKLMGWQWDAHWDHY